MHRIYDRCHGTPSRPLLYQVDYGTLNGALVNLDHWYSNRKLLVECWFTCGVGIPALVVANSWEFRSDVGVLALKGANNK
jgi:hypothetical protein